MNQRLLQFLSAENISQAQFADTIGVARASVSHILAGRNKPGFDFIESMSSHFPDLSLEWLINGKGKMYKSMSAAAPSPAPVQVASAPVPAPPAAVISDASDAGFFGISEPSEAPEAPAASSPLAAPSAALKSPEKSAAAAASSKASQGIAGSMSALLGAKSQRSISRIIVFYDDNTYQELK